MKKLLLGLLFFLPAMAQAQIYGPDTKFGTEHNRSNSLLALGVPRDTFSVPLDKQGYPHIAIKQNQLYIWDTTTGSRRWNAFVSGSPNSNIGSGYRLAVPGTNNIKTLFATNGLTLDSSSNANALTFKWGGRLSENTLIQGTSGVGPVYNLRLTDFYQLRLESFGSYSGFYSDSTGLSTAGGSGSTAMVHGGNYASTANYFKVIGRGVSGSSLFIQNSLGNSFIRLDSFYARPVKKYSVLSLEDTTNGHVKWKSPEQFASILQPYLSSGSQNLHSVLTAGNTSTIGAQFGDSTIVQGGVNPFLAIRQATSGQGYRFRVGLGTGLSSQVFSLYDETAAKTRMFVSSGGNIVFGGQSLPAAHTRLLVYGGLNGANIDALPDSTEFDESNIEVMGADYYGTSFTGYGVAMQFNGNANSGTILGYSKKNFGQLRFLGTTNFIRVINNASLRFATNNTERMVLTNDGRVGIGTASPGSWLHVQDADGGIATATLDAHEDRVGTVLRVSQAGVPILDVNESNNALKIYGTTSGHTEIKAAAAPTSWTMTLPPAAPGTNGYVLKGNTDGTTSWAAESGGSVSSASGTGVSLVNGSSLIKRLKAGTGITITDNTDSVTVNRVSDSTLVRNLRWKHRNTLDYMQDYDAAITRWAGTATGAGAIANDNANTTPNWMLDYFGVVLHSTGTTTTGSAISYYGAPSSGAGGTFRSENTKNLSFEVGKVLFPVLSDSTGGTDIYKASFGLFDWWASDIVQTGIQVYYDRSSHGNYWAIRSDNGSVSTVVTTTPIEDSTRYTIRLEVSRFDLGNSGCSVRVYINDTEVVASSGTYPITTNIPAATWQGNPFYLGLYIKKSAGTNARIMYADWTHIYAELLSR